MFQSLKAARAEAVWEALAQHVRPLPAVDLPVAEALGAVLAEDARAGVDYPPFDRTVMDGFAVRCADFSGGRARLRRLGLLRAGDREGVRVEAGTCVQINTGAALPPGADAVVMVEESRDCGDGLIELMDTPKPEQNIERRASLLRKGDKLLAGGARIGPGTVAALVSAGITRVRVHRRPRAALLSTGDELVAAGEMLEAGQIFDSNSIVLGELIRGSGCELLSLGRCPDDENMLRDALRRGLECDLLCVVGGMSKGTHDLVPAALEALGVEWLVESLRLKPGKPTRIGRTRAGAWVVGLAGNPVSCAVCFLLFARCILDGLAGMLVRPPPHVSARLEVDMLANGSRALYQPAEWSTGPDGVPCVRPVVRRGSGDPFGLATANALVHRAENAPQAARGELIRFIPLDCTR